MVDLRLLGKPPRPCSGDAFKPASSSHMSTCGNCAKHYSHGGKCTGFGGKFHAREAGVELKSERGRE